MPPTQLPEVVDLTGDDDEEELRKALDLSLGAAANGGSTSTAVFGPSERTDVNQSWAMVPSSQSQTQNPHKAMDADLLRAVEASMNMFSEAPETQERPRGDVRWA